MKKEITKEILVKETTNIKKVKKSFRPSKGVMAFTAGVALSGAALLTIGYLAPLVPANVDFIITETKATSSSMNYILHPGSATKFMSPVMESYIGRRADSNEDSLNRQFINSLSEEDSGTDKNVAEAIVEADKPLTLLDITNTTGDFNKAADWTVDGIDEEKVGEIVDINFSLKQADQMIVNGEKYDQMTIHLKDDLYWNNNTDWKSKNPEWINEELVPEGTQDRVKPSDFAFATQMFLNKVNGAANSYMYIKYTNINQAKECFENQNPKSPVVTIEEACGNSNSTDPLHKKWGNVIWDLDKEDLPGATGTKFEQITSENTNNEKPGIVFSNELNMIQYNLSTETPYFHTMMLTNILWPVNEDWYVETFGDTGYMTFGTTYDKIMTNGAFYPESYDSQYATYYKKSENYYNVDSIPTDRWMFRSIDETAQQALLFKQGYSSYSVLGDDANSFASDPTLSKYMQPSIAETNTRYTFFNMQSPENSGKKPEDDKTGSPNRVFTQNINFRKSLLYAFDRGNSLNLFGAEKALPSRVFTPAGMGTLNEGLLTQNDINTDVFKDMVNTADLTTGSNAGTYSAKDNWEKFVEPRVDGQEKIDFIDLSSLQSLNETAYTDSTALANGYGTNPWTSDLLTKSFTDIVGTKEQQQEFLNYQKDPVADRNALVDYYWSEFLKDMAALGETVPSTIELNYITTNAQTDVWYQGINQSIGETNLRGKVRLLPKPYASTPFWSTYYSGEFDILSLRWSPDFQDPWAFMSLTANYDSSYQGNNNGMWNVMYGTKDNPNYNMNSRDYNEGIFDLSQTTTDLNSGLNEFQERIFGNDPYGFEDKKWGWDNNNGLTMAEVVAEIYGQDLNGEKNYDNRFDYEKMYNLPDKDRYLMMAWFELILQDSAAYMVPHSAIVSQNASRLINLHSATVGYSSYDMAYDCRDPKYGLPGCDDMFEWTGK